MTRKRYRRVRRRGALIVGMGVLVVLLFAWTIGKDAMGRAQEAGNVKIQMRENRGSDGSKVALLFLTRGPMPLELIWKRFLGKSEDWERLFLVLVHAPPGYEYSKESVFYKREIKNPVPDVHWGQHSVVEAERRLLVAALDVEEAASHFVLLSETTIPLYHPAIVYLSIVKDSQSRVNACANTSDPADDRKRMVFRLQPGMQEVGVTTQTWRKSTQWFSLIRRHAELIARETEINAVFEKECYVKPAEAGFSGFSRFCVSDEHYIPTVLAVKHLDSECACNGETTRSVWKGDTFHPVEFGKSDAVSNVLHTTLRSQASCPQALQLEAFIKRYKDSSLMNVVLRMSSNVTALPASCPLFARKIAPSAASNWLELLSDDVLVY